MPALSNIPGLVLAVANFPNLQLPELLEVDPLMEGTLVIDRV